MKIIVTGCAGFIGSHIVEKLLFDECEVIGIDNFSTGKFENIKYLKSLNLDFKFIQADCRDYDLISEIFRDETESGIIDAVSHQAALGSVPRSLKEPFITTDHNVNGFQNVIHAAMINGIERFVYASSSSVYGTKGKNTSPYALSKAYNEMMAKHYVDSYEMQCVGLRYFNVFGPRQNPLGGYAAVIPKFISSIQSGEPIYIFGDGEQRRDFTYVENVVNANTQSILGAIDGNKILDIGCGESTSLNDLIGMIGLITGQKIKTEYTAERPGDARESLANIEEARKYIGYLPEVGIAEGLVRTISYFSGNNGN
jgi:nucleoside-diphosphate-sugar epimerase